MGVINMRSNALSYALSTHGCSGYQTINEGLPFSIFEQSLPVWQSEVYSQILKLLQLEENWDSYGAKKISISAAKAMFSVLSNLMLDDTPPPTIVPTSSGVLQAEWHTRNIDLEMEVISDSVIDVYFEDHNSQISKIEEELRVDLTKLGECIKLLTSRA